MATRVQRTGRRRTMISPELQDEELISGDKQEKKEDAQDEDEDEEDDDEDNEDEEEEESSDGEPIIPLLAGREKRVNAGSRMRALLEDEKGEGLEADEMFKRDDLVEGEEEDVDFEAKDEEDVFDSDFGSTDSGSAGEEDDDEAGERRLQREVKAERRLASGKKAKKVHQPFLPTFARQTKHPVKKPLPSLGEASTSTSSIPSASDSTQQPPFKKRRLSAGTLAALKALPARKSSSRKSAVNFKKSVEERLKENEQRRSSLPKPKQKTVKKLTQADLIGEALETEEINRASLLAFYAAEDDRRALDKLAGMRYEIYGPRITFLSRLEGVYNEEVGHEKKARLEGNGSTNANNADAAEKLESGRRRLIEVIGEAGRADYKPSVPVNAASMVDQSTEAITTTATQETAIIEPHSSNPVASDIPSGTKDSDQISFELKAPEGDEEEIELGTPQVISKKDTETQATSAVGAESASTTMTQNLPSKNTPEKLQVQVTSTGTPTSLDSPTVPLLSKTSSPPTRTTNLKTGLNHVGIMNPTQFGSPHVAVSVAKKLPTLPGPVKESKEQSAESLANQASDKIVDQGAEEAEKMKVAKIEISREDSAALLATGGEETEEDPTMEAIEQQGPHSRNYVILEDFNGTKEEEMSTLFGDHHLWGSVKVVPSRSRVLNRKVPICPITGLPAPYRDPKTWTPYASIAAYKIILSLTQAAEEAKVLYDQSHQDDEAGENEEKEAEKEEEEEEEEEEDEDEEVKSEDDSLASKIDIEERERGGRTVKQNEDAKKLREEIIYSWNDTLECWTGICGVGLEKEIEEGWKERANNPALTTVIKKVKPKKEAAEQRQGGKTKPNGHENGESVEKVKARPKKRKSSLAASTEAAGTGADENPYEVQYPPKRDAVRARNRSSTGGGESVDLVAIPLSAPITEV